MCIWCVWYANIQIEIETEHNLNLLLHVFTVLCRFVCDKIGLCIIYNRLYQISVKSWSAVIIKSFLWLTNHANVFTTKGRYYGQNWGHFLDALSKPKLPYMIILWPIIDKTFQTSQHFSKLLHNQRIVLNR